MGAALILDQVSKHYASGGVGPLSGEFYAGEVVALLGSNGAGKSTLLQLISGQQKLDQGSIHLGSMALHTQIAAARAAHVAMVSQHTDACTAQDFTLAENMALAELRGQRAHFRSALSLERLARYQENLSQLGMGLELRLHERVGSLSGGQRQALALAMAMLRPPAILLLDEHTAALDPKMAKRVLELTVQAVHQHSSIALMVTHHVRDAVQYADRIAVLHQGKLVADYQGAARKNVTVEQLLTLLHTMDTAYLLGEEEEGAHG